MEPEDIILAAAIHAEYSGVYCLGPDFGRVSFISQQYRAFNLVWALAKKRKLSPESEVAIVGAGLSGLTAAAACLAYGAKVKVFDQGTIEIPRQTSTTARFIHPKINWWPKTDDDNLNPTTDLPFLNWHSNTCADVVRQLMETWNDLRTTYRDKLDIQFRHLMEGMTNTSTGKRVILDFKAKNSHTVDLVILAVGFAEERVHPEWEACKEVFTTGRYWDNDNIERERNQDEKQVFIVSGFGDGGLIEVMRLAFKSNSGYLAYELALALAHPDLADELAELVAEDGQDARTKYLDLARKIYTARQQYGPADSDRKTALEPYLAASDLITRTIVSRESHRLYAVDRDCRHPACGEAASIYKLMAAIVEIADVVHFRYGTVTCLPSEGAARGKTKGKAQTPKVVSIQFEDENGLSKRQNFPVAETRVIVRHGAQPAIENYMAGSLYQDMTAAKKRAQDYNFMPAWRPRGEYKDPYIVPRGLGSRYSDLPAYVQKHYERALTALKMLNFQGWLKAKLDRYVVIAHRPYYRPSHLYGVEVEYMGIEQLRRVVIDD